MIEDVALTVAAVARRLGVAPATLRTWDRRYGLGPSEHSAGAHRRYSPGDVERLMTMRRLTLEGVAPSEAARSALRSQARPGAPSEAEVLEAYAEAEMPADPDALLGAARHADSAAVRWMLARVHPRDALEWYTALVRPALAVLADEPVVERPGDSACHRLEAAAFAELRSRQAALATRLGDAGPGAPAVLVIPLGAADLDAHVLAAALTGRGVAAGVLAGRSTADLAGAVSAARPRALVLLAAHQDRAADLARSLPPGALVLWHREGMDPVPAGLDVHRVRSLAGACHEVVAVLG